MLGSAPTLRAVLALSLVTIGLGIVAPTAGAQSPALDTVSVTGSAGDFRNIGVTAQAEPSGANASGGASFGLLITVPPWILTLGGPVTCVSVTGPDLGAGRPGAPTVAVLTFVDPDLVSQLGAIAIQVVDNGGGGADQFATEAFRSPSDCSPVSSQPSSLTDGRAVVFDAPVGPTSKADCKHGGWRDFRSMFRNQGQCIAFVNHRRHKRATG